MGKNASYSGQATFPLLTQTGEGHEQEKTMNDGQQTEGLPPGKRSDEPLQTKRGFVTSRRVEAMDQLKPLREHAGGIALQFPTPNNPAEECRLRPLCEQLTKSLSLTVESGNEKVVVNFFRISGGDPAKEFVAISQHDLILCGLSKYVVLRNRNRFRFGIDFFVTEQDKGRYICRMRAEDVLDPHNGNMKVRGYGRQIWWTMSGLLALEHGYATKKGEWNGLWPQLFVVLRRDTNFLNAPSSSSDPGAGGPMSGNDVRPNDLRRVDIAPPQPTGLPTSPLEIQATLDAMSGRLGDVRSLLGGVMEKLDQVAVRQSDTSDALGRIERLSSLIWGTLTLKSDPEKLKALIGTLHDSIAALSSLNQPSP